MVKETGIGGYGTLLLLTQDLNGKVPKLRAVQLDKIDDLSAP
jgi:hypothetical protein